MIEHGDEHGGDAIEAGNLLVIDAGETGFGREIRHGTHGSAVGHHVGHGQNHAEAVEHGHLNHHPVSCRHIHPVTDDLAVVHNISVGQHDTLGETGGAGGVLHIAHIVRADSRGSAANLFPGDKGMPHQHLLPFQAAVHMEAHGNHIPQERQPAAIQRITGVKLLQFGNQFLHDLLIIGILAVLNHHQCVSI